MGVKRLLQAVVAGAFLLSGCKNEISGVYTSPSVDNSASCLQIVQTPDNHLSGQLAFSTMDVNGQVTRHIVPFTGASSGQYVTLTLNNGLFGIGNSILSGTVKGGDLTLAGFNNEPVTLTRSSLSQCTREMASLNAASDALVKAKHAAKVRQNDQKVYQNLITSIDDVTDRTRGFELEADDHLGRFPKADSTYEVITAKVAEYVEHEKQLIGNPNAGVARSQLAIAASQTSFATDRLHNSATALEASLQTNVKPLTTRADELEQSCKATSFLASLTPAQIGTLNNACQRLFTAHAAFQTKLEAVENGLQHAEEVYRREREHQQELIKQSRQFD